MFDWEPEQDTSRDANAAYGARHEAALQFGRGLRAGVDRREAKTAAAAHEAALTARARASAAAQAQARDAAGGGEAEEAEDGGRGDAHAFRGGGALSASASAGAARGAALDAERRALALSLAKEDRYERSARAAAAGVAHWADKALSEMTERDWRIFREDHSISTKGGKVPNPFRTWSEAPLPEPILRAVEKVGYVKPSPIQMAAIPIGVAQRDVIGIAETGSGKTCAFVLPMLAYIMRLPVMSGNEEVEALGPYAVVLSPTRELAQQTEEECGKFAQYLDYRVVSVVGGQSIEEQGFKLRKGCEIVIGTPGRIIDCLERRYTVLHQCNFVVLDEADRMIDYGFEPQVTGVMDAMPSSNLKPVNEEEELEDDKIYRTTFMFSATMPPVVERLARKYMRNPAVVHIGSAGKAADLITQNVIMMRPDDKGAALEAALRAAGDTQVIVFVNTHKTCDYIGKVMERLGKPTCVLHGGKTQDAREFSIDGFRNKKYQVLIATDVAGRGIDVPDVGLVVNYQMPSTIEAYTHRIGRTGRAGRKGTATSFLTLEDKDIFYELKALLTESGNVVPPELARHEASRKKPQKGPDFGRNIES
jgi:ATP-dependent RNA helicase DDX23/PRP28